MLVKLRVKIVGKFGTNTTAAKALGINESRLSRIIHEHAAPTDRERQKITSVLGAGALRPNRKTDEKRYGEDDAGTDLQTSAGQEI